MTKIIKKLALLVIAVFAFLFAITSDAPLFRPSRYIQTKMPK